MAKPIQKVLPPVNTPRISGLVNLFGVNDVDRLKRLLAARGITVKAEFARMCGLPEGTVRQHMNRGSIPKDAAATYARVLRCSVDWLLYGRGPAPALDFEPGPDPPPAPVQGAAGAGGAPSSGTVVHGRIGRARPSTFAEEVRELGRELDRIEERVRDLRSRLGVN